MGRECGRNGELRPSPAHAAAHGRSASSVPIAAASFPCTVLRMRIAYALNAPGASSLRSLWFKFSLAPPRVDLQTIASFFSRLHSLLARIFRLAVHLFVPISFDFLGEPVSKWGCCVFLESRLQESIASFFFTHRERLILKFSARGD